ncbi:MAG TPA: hypothetical protein PKK49_15775, partial [Flavobacteriales bacterium]|nr:hypothetical protein [Flavobacteriales bacterium]
MPRNNLRRSRFSRHFSARINKPIVDGATGQLRIQLAMTRPPIGVITLSGWNCTPQVLNWWCRTAMITPDS